MEQFIEKRSLHIFLMRFIFGASSING